MDGKTIRRLSKVGKPALNIKMEAYLKMTPHTLAEKSIRQLKEYIKEGKDERIDETIAMLEVIKQKNKGG